MAPYPISDGHTDYSPLNYPSGTMNDSTYTSKDVDDQTREKKLYKFSDWMYEIISWIAGAAIIAGTVYILVHFNNTPVERWPFSIQISTVVSFLAQVAQAALLFPTEACIGQLKWTWFRTYQRVLHLQRFDEASRGPWGSLILLITLSPIPRFVHLGALIIIFMLVFPTFFQQAVQTKLGPLDSTAQPATVNRSMTYTLSPYLNAYYADTTGYSEVFASNTYLTSAIVSSMVGDWQNLSDVIPVCPSGQCDWESYTTLALCYATEDISTQLYEVPGSNMGLTNYTNITIPGIAPGNYTGWSTIVFSRQNGTVEYRGQKANVTIPELDLASPKSNLNDLAHIYTVYQDPCLMKNQSDNSIESYRALKAKLRLCLQTLKTVVYNTSTDTHIVDSFTNLTWSTESVDNSYPNVTTTLGNATEVFRISSKTIYDIANEIATYFEFATQYTYGSGGDNYVYANSIASNAVWEVIGPDPLTCPNSTEYGIKGLDKRIANVATGLTNAFRRSDSSVQVQGKSIRIVQFIHVRFWALAPPGALFVAITIFFVTTIIHTSIVPVWKSSQLAVLYALHEPEKLGTKGDMEKEAKKTNMGFGNQGNWQLEDD